MIERIKLKHLPLLGKTHVNIAPLMIEIDGYKNIRYRRRKRFQESFNRVYNLLEDASRIKVEELDINKLNYNKNCDIKKPSNIDDITFETMISLHTLTLGEGMKIEDYITEVIVTACYSSYTKKDFKKDGLEYKSLRWKVLESPFIYMLALYNWISKSLEDSSKLWDDLFAQVEVEDPDFKMAGGEMRGRFNVVDTLKGVSRDFNITYDKALKVSYALTQFNSLSKATTTFIQHNMSEIKERKMRINRNQK